MGLERVDPGTVAPDQLSVATISWRYIGEIVEPLVKFYNMPSQQSAAYV